MGVTLNSKEIKGKVNTTGLIATIGLIGSRGAKGDQGEQGNDGFSPIITTSKSGKVTTLTITDASGTKTATINDGADGQGSGDMLTSVYDQNLNGIVDNAEKVNNHTVESDVPSNAIFTDTTYTAGTGIDITNNVISNTQTSAEWGNITGTLNSQTDLKNALDTKQDVIDSSNKLPYSYISGTPTIPTKLSDLTNDNNTVTDASYVHTDNNYTTAEKNKLAGVDDIIVVGNETPTSQTEVVFEETDLNAQFSDVLNEYSTTQDKAYSCDYINNAIPSVEILTNPTITQAITTLDMSYKKVGNVYHFSLRGTINNNVNANTEYKIINQNFSGYKSGIITFERNTSQAGTFIMNQNGLYIYLTQVSSGESIILSATWIE